MTELAMPTPPTPPARQRPDMAAAIAGARMALGRELVAPYKVLREVHTSIELATKDVWQRVCEGTLSGSIHYSLTQFGEKAGILVLDTCSWTDAEEVRRNLLTAFRASVPSMIDFHLVLLPVQQAVRRRLGETGDTEERMRLEQADSLLSFIEVQLMARPLSP